MPLRVDPGMRSFDIGGDLKRDGVPFVFITGYDQEVISERFGDVARVQKPVEFRHVIGALGEGLGLSLSRLLGAFTAIRRPVGKPQILPADVDPSETFSRHFLAPSYGPLGLSFRVPATGRSANVRF